MIALVFPTLILFLGLHALISGNFQLNRYITLHGVSARFAGVILLAPLLLALFVGLATADWQGTAHSLIGCSYVSIICVLAFAALQAGLAKLCRKEHPSNGSESKAPSKIILPYKKHENAHHSARL
jgi:hypothetical protein